MVLLKRLLKHFGLVERDLGPHRFWFTEADKFAGIEAELAAKGQNNSVAILLVAHFQETRDQLDRILETYQGSTPARCVFADELLSQSVPSLGINPTESIDIILAERHPLLQIDRELIVEMPKELACQHHLSVHFSMDDRLLGVYDGDAKRELIKRVGMIHNREVVHQMLIRQILAKQKAIAVGVPRPIPSKSMVQWYKSNGLSVEPGKP
jgi:hypothetical protein